MQCNGCTAWRESESPRLPVVKRPAIAEWATLPEVLGASSRLVSGVWLRGRERELDSDSDGILDADAEVSRFLDVVVWKVHRKVGLDLQPGAGALELRVARELRLRILLMKENIMWAIVRFVAARWWEATCEC